jgi:glycosyltransferase involved in cell wall biosynthesis
MQGLGLPVTVLPVPRGRDLPRMAAAIRALTMRAAAVDLVYANDVRSAVFCQVAAGIAGRPWLWAIRDLVAGRHRYEKALRLVRPTRMSAISRAVKDQAVAYGHWDPARIEVIYHGIDAAALEHEAHRPAWRAEMGLGEHEVAVGIVGRLLPWKGQEDFLRAAAAVKTPGARFFVVGGALTDRHTQSIIGDYPSRLRSLVQQLGIGDRVTFTGQRSDIASVMAGLDVCVLASENEPFGNVMLEAMAVGTPVVATAAGGAPEVVVHGETGFLVPPRRPAELASAIQLLVDNKDLRSRFGRGGYDRVRRAFVLPVEAQQTRACWEAAARRGRPAAANLRRVCA